MSERVQIIIEALNLAKDELEEVERELKDIDKQGERTSKGGLASMQGSFLAIGGALTGMGIAAKQAFEFAKQGAELERTEQQFYRLAETIGTTGDALRTELDAAMGDVISNSDKMKVAVDLMSLGLVENSEQAARLAAVYSQLGMDMNQLVLTLTNKTTMRFDALGVSVAGFDERLEELSKTMSDEKAFTMAFLEQAEKQVEKVGDVADTSAGQIKMLQAEWQNYVDSVKKSLSEAVEPGIRAINEQRQAEEQLQHALEMGAIAQSDYNRIQSLMNRNMMQADVVLDFVKQSMDEWRQSVEGSNPTLEKHNRLMEIGSQKNQEFGETIIKAGEDADEATIEVGGLLDEVNRDIGSPMKEFIADLEWFSQTGGTFEEAFAGIQEAVDQGKITPEQGKKFTENLLIGFYDVQTELNNMNINQAAREMFREGLADSVQDAYDKLAGTEGLDEAMQTANDTLKAMSDEGLTTANEQLSKMYGHLDNLTKEPFSIDAILNIISSYNGQTDIGGGGGGGGHSVGAPPPGTGGPTGDLSTSTMEGQLDTMIGLMQQQNTDLISAVAMNK
jgi:hypothetical protein